MSQKRKVYNYLLTTGATMKEVSETLNIDRANVCRYIADFSKSKKIWVVSVSRCRITHAPAMFLTTNFEIAQMFPNARLK